MPSINPEQAVIGWDIGGANIKAVRLQPLEQPAVLSRPFELWREPDALPGRLQEMALALGRAGRHAVTMTAELADCFVTKREGVHAIIAAVEEAFPGARVAIWGTDGAFHTPDTARAQPLLVAAANWMATAEWIARAWPRDRESLLLVDVGSTTTDIIPIWGGMVRASGRADPERLLSGELVYTGVVRTNCAAVVRHVPVWGGDCPVASELFSISGDVHVWLGHIDPSEYDAPTPDGRPADRRWCGTRLARLVCADREMLGDDEVTAIAKTVHEAQVSQIVTALERVVVRSHDGGLRGEGQFKVVTTGQGHFLAAEAAARAGLEVASLVEVVGRAANRATPAFAVAALFILEADGAADQDRNQAWR